MKLFVRLLLLELLLALEEVALLLMAAEVRAAGKRLTAINRLLGQRFSRHLCLAAGTEVSH